MPQASFQVMLGSFSLLIFYPCVDTSSTSCQRLTKFPRKPSIQQLGCPFRVTMSYAILTFLCSLYQVVRPSENEASPPGSHVMSGRFHPTNRTSRTSLLLPLLCEFSVPTTYCYLVSASRPEVSVANYMCMSSWSTGVLPNSSIVASSLCFRPKLSGPRRFNICQPTTTFLVTIDGIKLNTMVSWAIPSPQARLNQLSLNHTC